MSCKSEIADRRPKRIEIFDLRVQVTHIQGIFECSVSP